MIVSAYLSKVKIEELLRELGSHHKVIGYTIDDIKGINPLICMDRILLESDYKPSVEPQRRLNPNVVEVAKKRC